jgi:hypothetical protein
MLFLPSVLNSVQVGTVFASILLSRRGEMRAANAQSRRGQKRALSLCV